MDTWLEDKYQNVYENTLAHVRELRNNDPDFTLQTLENLLETEYHNQGRGDRNQITEIVSEATISAYQRMLVEWKSEKEGPVN